MEDAQGSEDDASPEDEEVQQDEDDEVPPPQLMEAEVEKHDELKMPVLAITSHQSVCTIKFQFSNNLY